MGSPWIRRLSDRPEYFPTRVRRSDNSPRPIKIAAPLLPWVEPKGDLKLSRRGHSGPRRGVCAMRTPDLGPNPWQTLRHGLPANAVGRALGPTINSEGSNPAWLGTGEPAPSVSELSPSSLRSSPPVPPHCEERSSGCGQREVGEPLVDVQLSRRLVDRTFCPHS